MKRRKKDISYFVRLENAVRFLATSPKSPRLRVEQALTNYLLPIIPEHPQDAIDEKLCQARALATKYPAEFEQLGDIRTTMLRVRYPTLEKIMELIFDAYLLLRPTF